MTILRVLFGSRTVVALSLVAILFYLTANLYFNIVWPEPLLIAIFWGGGALLFGLGQRIWQGNFGSDILAGVSIIGCYLLDEYLAATVVVLMLSGGEALEAYALGRASQALSALAKRMPTTAHRVEHEQIVDIAIDEVQVEDHLFVYPHEIYPVDGEIVSGKSSADESYLTGEPYLIEKGPGSSVISGSINGTGRIKMVAHKRAKDSRYSQIMRVMEDSKQRRPQLRRVGDMLGAFYTPLIVGISLLVYLFTGEIKRSLAVLVVATPCPLLIAIPIAIIGAISLAAKRSIIIKDPVALERAPQCSQMIFDKTGTLTSGEPVVTEIAVLQGAYHEREIIQIVASLERYSKHPLAQAIINEVKRHSLSYLDVDEVHEAPGEGLRGIVSGLEVLVTSRSKLDSAQLALLPERRLGLECVILIDKVCVALFRFRDQAREDSKSFIAHIEETHRFNPSILLSGDPSGEVPALAEAVGISILYGGKSPEEKVAIVRSQTVKQGTIYLGDGINDAPALLTATVGIAFGSYSDITAEAAGVVILEPKLKKVDEFIHISKRMRRIALESAVGGMALSFFGVLGASFGYISPLEAAILQEVIDLLAVGNALRSSYVPRNLFDYVPQ